MAEQEAWLEPEYKKFTHDDNCVARGPQIIFIDE